MFDRETLTDHVGAYRTQSLFLETNASSLKPLMTLKEVDWEYKGEVLPSLKKIYMECGDPTEYAVAIKVFNSWPQWLKILENKAIRKYIDEWREELDIKIRSQAVLAMAETAFYEGSKGTTAAKYLAEKGYIKRKAGAPSKEERAGLIKQDKEVKRQVAEDAARLGIMLQ